MFYSCMHSCVRIPSPLYRDYNGKTVMSTIIQNTAMSVPRVFKKTALQKSVSKAFSLLMHSLSWRLWAQRKVTRLHPEEWLLLSKCAARELPVKHGTCWAIRRHWVSCTSVWCWGDACRHMKTWFPRAEGVTLLLQLKVTQDILFW